MSTLHAITLGIVEGITEFLPISSTGHLILTSNLLKIDQGSFTKSFEIIIQLGAISSVIFLYWKKLWQLETIKKLIVAFIPTGIIGLLLYKIVKAHLLGNTTVVLFSLLLGGIALIIFELWYKPSGTQHEPASRHGAAVKDAEHASENGYGSTGEDTVRARTSGSSESREVSLSNKQALIIGLFQSIAIIPGISRSASTIIGGLLLGLNRHTIVEFSFLLAVPTMLAASTLDLLKNYSGFSDNQFSELAIGFIVSFFVALLSIKFLLNYIKKHNFTPFGIYRILIAVIFLFLI